MCNIHIVLLALFGYCVSASSSNEGKYFMLVPTVIQENSLVTVIVYGTNFKSEQQFQVKLEELSDGYERKELSNQKGFLQNDSLLFEFRTQSLKDAPHQITVTGPSGKEHHVDLKVLKRPPIILIQTDKPIYKPGDTIKFRILVLDHQTRPLNNLKTVKVQLKDSNGNLIYEWPLAALHHGVFQSQIELANFIPLGDWTITVFALKNERQDKSFTVAKYVLPTYEIRITNPKRTAFKDDSLMLIVDAWYTFGKPINGNLSITFTETNYSQNLTINGRATSTVALKDVVDTDYKSDVLWLEVNAQIEETSSGQIYRASQSIPINRRSHKIELRKSSKYVLSDEVFTFAITVTDPDGFPFQNPDSVTVNVITSPPFPKPIKFTGVPDANGDLSSTLFSIKNASKIDIEVTYNGEMTKFEVEHENFVRGDDKSFFQATIWDSQPKLNQSVKVWVQSSFRMNTVFYHVISQGQIMTSGRVSVADRRSVFFTVQTNFSVISFASLAVFAVHNGQLRTNFIRLKTDDLYNNVFIHLSTKSTAPGDQIHVTVKSQPGSMIGLLALDAGMLQFGTKNDITKQHVLNMLRQSNTDEDDELERLGFRLVQDTQPTLEVDTRFLDYDDLFDYALFPNTIRKNFPETWLWMPLAPVDASGELVIDATVPDTITSWSITAFSINENTGLGIIERPVSLNVLKPFFITVSTAYSIVKTETALVKIFVHNYLDQDQLVSIKVLNAKGEFQFVNKGNVTNLDFTQLLYITVPRNSVGKVEFMLKPTKTGNLVISVTAECESARDAVQHNLRVTPGGLLYVENHARYIEVEQSSMNFTNIRLSLPKSATPGSESITFSAEGILLGAALENLDHLIRLPSGCGEQNMLNLVPSVLALEYMSSTATLKDSIRAKAIEFLGKGYQNQLNYKLNDGSFSVFGKNDGRGSVFLTSMTAKIFKFASKHIVIDSNVINNAYKWLTKQQRPNGQFIETGRLYYKPLQSNLKDGSSLTAYVLISMLEHKTVAQKYRTIINKGVNFIVDSAYSLTSPYDLALVAYTLTLANHAKKDYFFDKLVEQAQFDGKLRWWATSATSIETTAYALLTYMRSGLNVDGYSIMKWLVSQRYDKGGYANTQNTFVGLQALAEYSQKMSMSRNDYDIIVAYNGGRHSLHMDPETSLNGVTLTLPTNIGKANVHVNGTGFGVFQITCQYNAESNDLLPRFRIETTLDTTVSLASLKICTYYEPKRSSEEIGMVMMEVSLPSGYFVNKAEYEFTENDKIRKTETNDRDTHLIFYLEPLVAYDPFCVNISMFALATVFDKAPGWIKVYDYYDPTREALEYFTLKEEY